MIGLFQADLLNSNNEEEFSTGSLSLKAKPERGPISYKNQPFCYSFAENGSSICV